MVDSVNLLAPLGKSDHAVLVFEYICYWTSAYIDSSPIPAYHRGDYAGLNAYFSAFQWESIQSLPIDDMEDAITSTIVQAASKFIPTFTPSPHPPRKFPRYIRTLIRRKQSAYQRYKLTQ